MSDPCKLYCRSGSSLIPKGLVKDGTKCQFDEAADNNDVCVGGKCMSVGCDYGFGSGFVLDRCKVCNGDSTSCTLVVETYTNDWREKGIDNAELMYVVPKGSRRILVGELAKDKNSIALQGAKKNYLIKLPSGKTVLEAAGSTITYDKRSGKEFIDIPGPINQALRFMFVFNAGKNKGVKCKYFTSKKSEINPNDVEWIEDTESGWSACSEACAGGNQTLNVKCTRKDDKSIVADSACKGSVKPQDVQTCNTQPCEPKWYVPAWSSCSMTCGHGVMTRKVECRMKVQNPAVYQTVSDGSCKESKPDTTKSCFKVACPPEWLPSLWGECSKTCGGGIITRTLSCKRQNSDDSFSPVPAVFCQKTIKPPLTEECNVDVPCKAKPNKRRRTRKPRRNKRRNTCDDQSTRDIKWN
ncbi:metalloendopeptidase [Desmophyllum pertusum]|uniref:Metalloendopeptidase n=1 Tax=Desmophyllum pertusum TaxID=174260 RepID=A0A9X0CHF3_9CNID|nr:metalloendopeptidase [Desmophyllum pertusum]